MYKEEIAATVIQPYFDAVKDVFVAFAPDPEEPLEKLRSTRLVIDERVFDGGRHFAGCRDDGSVIVMAPEASGLPEPTLLAVVSHEFGHAADFAYPARWVFAARGQPASWVKLHRNRKRILSEEGRRAADYARSWRDRDPDQIEWSADSIALTVLGKKIQYCGPCLLQCFSGGIERPRGLR